MEKKLKRGKDRVLGGVCDGLGEYFDIEPMIWRLMFLIMVFIPTIPSFIIYILCWMIIPKNK